MSESKTSWGTPNFLKEFAMFEISLLQSIFIDCWSGSRFTGVVVQMLKFKMQKK